MFYIYRYYGGAANGDYSYVSLNYDLVNCNEIKLEDIFSDKNLIQTLEVDSLFDEGIVELPQSYREEVLTAWIESDTPAWVHAATHEVAKVLCLLDYDLCDMYKLEDDFLVSPNVSPSIDWLSRFVLDECITLLLTNTKILVGLVLVLTHVFHMIDFIEFLIFQHLIIKSVYSTLNTISNFFALVAAVYQNLALSFLVSG